MTAIKLVIFDCDGVLIDSEAMGATALASAISDAGVPMTTQTADARDAPPSGRAGCAGLCRVQQQR